MATNEDFKVKNGMNAQAFNAFSTPTEFQATGGMVMAYNGSGVGVLRAYGNNSGSAGTILFTNVAGNESMRITSTGSVGIGTTSPAYRMHIASSGAAVLGVFRDIDVVANGAAGTFLEFGAKNVSTFVAGSQIQGILNSTTTGSMTFSTLSTTMLERMRITSGGAVLVGTGAQLNTNQFGVLAAASTNAILAQVTTNANSLFQGFNAGGVLQFQMTGSGNLYSASTVAIGNQIIQRSANLFVNAANVSLASTTANVYVNTTNTQAIDVGGSMAFGGKNDNAGASDAPFAYIAGRKENGTAGNFAGYFQIGVTQGNAATIEAMRVTSAGDVGIGTPTPSVKLDVVGAGDGGLQYRTGTRTVGIGQTSSEASVYWGSGTMLTFFSGSERMRIGSNGNMAIGTTATDVGRLTITPPVFAGAESAKAAQRWTLGYNNGANGYSAYFKSTGNFGYVLNTDWAARLSLGVNTGTANNDTTFVEHLTIITGGNVGIGTIAPANKLHVRGTTTANQFLLNLTTDFVNTGTVSMGIGGFADASGAATAGASFRAHHNHSITSAVDLSFWTSPAGAVGQAERMRITSSGAVGIGETSPGIRLTVSNTAAADGVFVRSLGFDMNLSGSSNGLLLGANSTTGLAYVVASGSSATTAIVFATAATAAPAERMRVNTAGITVTGTVTETSTIRIKKNVRPIEGALEKVMGLQGVVYDMIDDSAHNQHGLIAEEVQKVMPNVVYRDEDGEVAGVQYARIVAVLIEAMKEQEARIKALEAIIAKD